MPVKVIIPPAVEPVTIAEARLHARIDHDLEDGLLATFIAAARQHGEQLTGRQFVEAAYELSLDGFPCGDDPIELPKPPLRPWRPSPLWPRMARRRPCPPGLCR